MTPRTTWRDVLAGTVDLTRLARERGSLHTLRGLDPQDAPDPEDFEPACRPAYTEGEPKWS